jgi:hypothetical protein
MEIQINYPTAKCQLCGKPFKKTHNRQVYCSKECSKEARRLKRRKYDYTYYRKNRNRINQKRLGTRTIGPTPNPNPEREREIINNEIERIGLNVRTL